LLWHLRNVEFWQAFKCLNRVCVTGGTFMFLGNWRGSQWCWDKRPNIDGLTIPRRRIISRNVLHCKEVFTAVKPDRLTGACANRCSVWVLSVYYHPSWKHWGGDPQGYVQDVSQGSGLMRELAVQHFSWRPRIVTSTTSSRSFYKAWSSNQILQHLRSWNIKANFRARSSECFTGMTYLVEGSNNLLVAPTKSFFFLPSKAHHSKL
jgi:hypothetical protein